MCKSCFIVIVYLGFISDFVSTQMNFEYRPRARGGHFIHNGGYQNYAPVQDQIHPQQNYNNYQNAENIFSGGDSVVNSIGNPTAAGSFHNYPQQNYYQNYRPPSTSNVIGNHAENIFTSGNSAVNSIVNPPAAGSSTNVIGNNAYNVHGRGPVNSVVYNPYSNLPGLGGVYDSSFADQVARSTLQNVFSNLQRYYNKR